MAIFYRLTDAWNNWARSRAIAKYRKALRLRALCRFEKATRTMTKAARALEKCSAGDFASRARVVLAYWDIVEPKTGSAKGVSSFQEIAASLFALADDLSTLDALDDPAHPERVVSRTSLAKKLDEWTTGFLCAALKEGDYHEVGRILSIVRAFRILTDAQPESVVGLAVGEKVCRLVMAEDAAERAVLIREILDLGRQTTSVEWPPGSGAQVESERLLRELDCIRKADAWAEAGTTDALAQYVDALSKVTKEDAFVILDTVMARRQHTMAARHFSTPKALWKYHSGLLECKRGDDIVASSVEAAFAHYERALQCLRECGDPGWEQVQLRIEELKQKGTCCLCEKEKTGLRVNYDLVKIDPQQAESVLFRLVASALREPRGPIRSDLVPVCRGCRAVVESVVTESGYQMRDTVLAHIRAQAEQSERQLQAARDEALKALQDQGTSMVTVFTTTVKAAQSRFDAAVAKMYEMVDTVFRRLKEENEALAARGREELRQLTQVGEQWVGLVQSEGQAILNTMNASIDELWAKFERAKRGYDERLKDMDSKIQAFMAVVGADLIGGFFSGRTLKQRMDEVEAELSRVKERLGV